MCSCGNTPGPVADASARGAHNDKTDLARAQGRPETGYSKEYLQQLGFGVAGHCSAALAQPPDRRHTQRSTKECQKRTK